MAAQGECIWIHQKLMAEMIRTNGRHFKSAEYASIQVPTYPCGQISALVLSKDRDSCSKPVRYMKTEKGAASMDLRYYTAKMHEAAFVLPSFVQKTILNVT